MPRFLSWTLAALLATSGTAGARRSTSPGPSMPAAAVVTVSTEAQLQVAVQQLASDTTISIVPGTYVLSKPLAINGAFSNVVLRGASRNRDEVVLVGAGMTDPAIPYGIWVGGNVQRITIADLTIRDVFFHAIVFNAGTQAPRVSNVHLIDAGEQFIKSNPDAAGGGVHDGIVESSVLEYTRTAKSDYTNGIDVHAGVGWTVRGNVFRNIVAPPGRLAGPAVLMWNHSSGTIVENNTFVNCARGISFGLREVAAGTDHAGGIIRSNVFLRSSAQPGDVAIAVFDSPNTRVLDNTVFVSGSYRSPIEYRFRRTTGVVIANNTTDGVIAARDGASATLQDNVEGAAAEPMGDGAYLIDGRGATEFGRR